RNLFATKGSIALDSTTALLLNVAPHQTLSIKDAATDFKLEDLRQALSQFGRAEDVGFDKLKIWHKFRIQLSSVHRRDILMPAETVQAFPPTPLAPYGTCDTVMIKDHDMDQSTAIDGECSVHDALKQTNSYSNEAFRVVQVHLVFQAVPRVKESLPRVFEGPLAYVQYFKFAGQRDMNGVLMEERDVDMYLLKQHRRANGKAVGGIVSLVDVARPVEIVPVFGQVCHSFDDCNLLAANAFDQQKCNPNFTSENSLDIGDKYYLNNFSDNEIYATLLNEYDGLT
ncbi:hypothetical protein DXG01_012947, partial [Tephrocybe rancida]